MVLTERGEISEYVILIIFFTFKFIRNYVKFMRARGLEICAWTVNDELEMVTSLNLNGISLNFLKNLGMDGTKVKNPIFDRYPRHCSCRD